MKKSTKIAIALSLLLTGFITGWLVSDSGWLKSDANKETQVQTSGQDSSEKLPGNTSNDSNKTSNDSGKTSNDSGKTNNDSGKTPTSDQTPSNDDILTTKLSELPDNVQESYQLYHDDNWSGKRDDQPEGTKAGGEFTNREGILPKSDQQKKKITYREYDVNDKKKNQNRDAERFVRGTDGTVYYTDDHYESFCRIAE